MPLDLLRVVAGRTLVLWGLVRIVFIACMKIIGVPIAPHLITSVEIIAIVTILFTIDLARRGERLLFANLGVDRHQVLGVTATITLVAELGMAATLTFLHT